MSTQRLSDATAELGYRIPRSVLANLEGDRRESVSVAELLVLGAALKVPPLYLAFPAGRAREVEVLPGVTAEPFNALDWAYGAMRLRGREDLSDTTLWTQMVQHSSMVHQLESLTTRREGKLAASENLDDPLWLNHQQDAEKIKGLIDSQGDALAAQRGQMRAWGVIPPDLPDHLVRFDSPDEP